MREIFYGISLFLLFSSSSCKDMNKSDHSNDQRSANKLINESSPYLLQHAYNPVEWYPWGDEAIAKAKSEDKLLIISIGYAACHWCHVMEHESFEDSLVAALMNEHFVSIKVDREERPDVDDVYMTAAQLLTGSGGWPLNAIALPDGRPVFAGTYFPKEKWKNILNQLVRLKQNDPQKLEESAEKITHGIRGVDDILVNEEELDFNLGELTDFNDKVVKHIDFKEGGRKGAPKFPMPNTYEYLLKYYWHTGDEKSKEAVNVSLDKMAQGGIYDQLGGGFARYSTDDKWLVPHFEKMLYDNGQLISLYAQAYRVDKNPFYESVIRKSLDFIERELHAEEGGFYSSLDADSEGVEGKFYVWSQSEIDSLIGNSKHAEVYSQYYGVKKHGNWEETNILHINKDLAQVAKKHNLSIEQVEQIINDANEKLFKFRAKRIRPGLDDKVLTSWNALMINGYLDAYNALGDEAYLKKAVSNMNFILENQMSTDGRLNRNYKNGKSSINGFLDDYAILINSLMNLYQSTFDENWLDQASLLIAHVEGHFFNDDTKMFNYTSDLDPPLIARKSEFTDNVIPGSNSMMARNLFTLGTLKYNQKHVQDAHQMLKNMHPQLRDNGMLSFFSNWMQLYVDFAKAPHEIAIVGPNAKKLRKDMASHYLGNSLLLGGINEGSLDLLKDKLQEGDTYIYVCKNRVCKIPVKTVKEALELIDNGL